MDTISSEFAALTSGVPRGETVSSFDWEDAIAKVRSARGEVVAIKVYSNAGSANSQIGRHRNTYPDIEFYVMGNVLYGSLKD